jgi:hypothetical protein
MATQNRPNQREVHVERVSGDDVFEVKERDTDGQERTWTATGTAAIEGAVKERGGVVKTADIEVQQELVQEATVVTPSREEEQQKPAQRAKQRDKGQELGY